MSCDPITFSSLRATRQRAVVLNVWLTVDQSLVGEISKAVSELRGDLKVRSGRLFSSLCSAMKGLWISFVLWLLWVNVSVTAGQGHLLDKLDTHRQLEVQLISQHNDSDYVKRVMGLAKSAEIRSYMQPQLDACEDFFAYSCGNWAKINPANAVRPRETNYQQLLASNYKHKQQRLLEQPADEERDDGAVLKLKLFYASCLERVNFPSHLYRRQLAEIVAEFEQKAGEDFDWLTTVAQIKRKYGLDILLRLQEAPDPHKRNQTRLYVGQPKQEEVIPADEEHVAHQLERQLGLQPEEALSRAQGIVEFEKSLTKGTSNRPIGVLAQPRSAAELGDAYAPVFNLTRYVELALPRPLLQQELLYEHVPSYLAHLKTLLTQTPPQKVSNYVFYKLLQRFYFEQEEQVVPNCVSSCRELFPELLHQMAYRHYGDAGALNEIDTVWRQLKESFQGTLENSTTPWLSAATQELLVEQLNATQLVLDGYADFNFTAHYQQLELKTEDYVANLRAVLSYGQTVPRAAPVENAVVLPVELLQPNFLWSRFYPRALRYASLGTILAQQLVHQFDNCSGWDSTSLVGHKKRKACFKHQYERLRYDGDYLPPSEQQDDNIADNVAIQLAYDAYASYLGSLSTPDLASEKLPQLSLDPQQLFFISYAQLWCNDANEQFRDKQALLATAIPNALRVQGALANFAVFARTFGCASGTRLNPDHKCHMYSIALH